MIANRHTLDVHGRLVGYRRSGHGGPVAVLGALDRSARSTRALAEVLGAGHTVLAIDPPGDGASEALDPGAGVASVGDWLAATLDALAPEGCPLIGVGSGGLAALELARRGRPQVILDDVPVLDAAARARVAAGWAPPNPIRADGTHVLAHWARRRAEQLWFPWFEQTPAAALERELAIDELHDAVMDAVARGERWAEPYEAIWSYPAVDVDAPQVRALRPSSPRFGAPSGELVPAGPGPAERHAVIADQLARAATGAPPSPVPPPAAAPRRPGRWTRGFATTPWGQLAVRRHDPAAGPTHRPLVALHASPLAGASLLGLAGGLLERRTVLLPDTVGNGDSPAPDPASHPEFRTPGVDRFAAALLAAVTDLGIDEFDLYGTHSGAAIAIEAAIAAPRRVMNLVLSGVPVDAPSAPAAEAYLVDLTPTGDGAHLQRGWSNVVDVLTWYPWHARDPAHRRAMAMPDAASLHERFAQFALAGTGYPLPFRAVLTHPTRERLTAVSTRTLLCHVPGDPLAASLAETAAGIDRSEVVEVPADPAGQAVVIDRWLTGGDP